MNAGPISQQLQSLQNSTNYSVFNQISFRESKKRHGKKKLSSINSMSLQLSSQQSQKVLGKTNREKQEKPNDDGVQQQTPLDLGKDTACVQVSSHL